VRPVLAGRFGGARFPRVGCDEQTTAQREQAGRTRLAGKMYGKPPMAVVITALIPLLLYTAQAAHMQIAVYQGTQFPTEPRMSMRSPTLMNRQHRRNDRLDRKDLHRRPTFPRVAPGA
jgi:hypothetical protein